MCQDCIRIEKLDKKSRIEDLEAEWMLIQEYLEDMKNTAFGGISADALRMKLEEIETELSNLTQEV